MENINKIYFDTDNLSEFLKHNKEYLLFELFGKNGVICISNDVRKELYPQNPDLITHPLANHFRNKVEDYIERGYISVVTITSDSHSDQSKILHDLVHTQKLGYGEASCIALSTTTKNPMASNNYHDIGVFVRN